MLYLRKYLAQRQNACGLHMQLSRPKLGTNVLMWNLIRKRMIRN